MTWFAFFAGLFFGACIGLLAAGLFRMNGRHTIECSKGWAGDADEELAH